MTIETQTDDFSEFMLDESSTVAIELPTGDPMLFKGAAVAVNVYGPASKQYEKAKEDLDKEASKRVMNAMSVKGVKKKDEDKDADIRFLVAVTSSIDNFPYPGGPEAVYREPKFRYIADQVRAHLNDLGNFFGPGKKS